MPQIIFEIGNHTFPARLNDKTPNICKQLLRQLPIETFAVHAKFAGEEMIAMVPFYAEAENEILAVSAGDIGYYPGRQTICLFYGEVTPFGPVSVFASLVQPFAAVRAAALEILENNSLPVSIRADARGRGSIVLPDAPSVGFDQKIPEFVQSYWKQSWLTTPADVLRLKQTRRPPSGNMSCILYACFDLFWLGEELQVLRKLILKHMDQAVALEGHWETAAALLRHHAVRLDKWEMTDTAAFLRQLGDFFSSGIGDPKYLLSALETSWIALNRVQSFTDAVIAWNKLDQYWREIELEFPPQTPPL